MCVGVCVCVCVCVYIRACICIVLVCLCASPPLSMYLTCDLQLISLYSLSFAKSMASMDSPEFLKLLAKYKFAIAMENAVCDDYITEKYWRAVHLGNIPIVFGSPKIKVRNTVLSKIH